jgi:hypothetical protein
VRRDLVVQASWGGALLQVITARLGGNDESGRHWQTQIGHFGQVGTLATQQVFQVPISFGES